MKIFILLTLFGLYNCEFPFPSIKEKDLYIINNIGINETFEISFYKPTLIKKTSIYFYENKNNIKYLPGWLYEYYIIESGYLYKTEYIPTESENPVLLSVPFNHNIFLRNSTYGKHVYVDPGVKLKLKIWSTNNTEYDATRYLVSNK